MAVVYADVATPAHAVKVADRLRERRTGEVREVVMIARTLTEFRFYLDDKTSVDAGFLDTLLVTDSAVS